MVKKQSESNVCISVAVFAPLRTEFDYLPPEPQISEKLSIGQRVWVPFGNGYRVGVILSTKAVTNNNVVLKKIIELLDEKSLLSPQIMQLAAWASKYYHHPIGETLSYAFPAGL